jgi:hypothetical protein
MTSLLLDQAKPATADGAGERLGMSAKLAAGAGWMA